MNYSYGATVLSKLTETHELPKEMNGFFQINRIVI